MVALPGRVAGGEDVGVVDAVAVGVTAGLASRLFATAALAILER